MKKFLIAAFIIFSMIFYMLFSGCTVNRYYQQEDGVYYKKPKQVEVTQNATQDTTQAITQTNNEYDYNDYYNGYDPYTNSYAYNYSPFYYSSPYYSPFYYSNWYYGFNYGFSYSPYWNYYYPYYYPYYYYSYYPYYGHNYYNYNHYGSVHGNNYGSKYLGRTYLSSQYRSNGTLNTPRSNGTYISTPRSINRNENGNKKVTPVIHGDYKYSREVPQKYSPPRTTSRSATEFTSPKYRRDNIPTQSRSTRERYTPARSTSVQQKSYNNSAPARTISAPVRSAPSTPRSSPPQNNGGSTRHK